MKRTAAIETGAIEGLYDVDRGFTYSVAVQVVSWEATLDAKGKTVRALIESQLKAYDYVLDFTTEKQPIAEAWIRELHRQLCEGQKTYTVHTEVGLQEHPLPLGEYKHLPNHVTARDGSRHSYAPVDLTPAEMHRFCEDLHSDVFQSARPVLQAAYAHYGLVAIPPFADGNGRVARALASVYTYRVISSPLLILAENRQAYFSALAAADHGDYKQFVDFILTRCLDAIQLINQKTLSEISYNG